MIDKTAPIVTLTKVNGSTVAFPFSTNANVTSIGGACGSLTGDSATINVTVDASPTAPASTSCVAGAWTLTLTTAITAEGTYVFAATQGDTAGNTGSSGNKSVTIDKTAPIVTLTKVNGSTVAFPFSTNANVTSIGGACGSLTGDSATINVTVDASPTAPASTSCVAGAWTLTLTTAITAEGTYVFAATQGDTAGNTGSSGNKSVTIDKTAPDVTIDQAIGQSDPTNGAAIHFTAVFTEPVTGFDATDVSLSGSGTAGVTSVANSGDGMTFDILVTASGDGTVVADIGFGVATDAAGNGNTASTSTDNIVTYDTIAPTGTITINDDDTYTNSTSVTLNLDATDTNGIVSYRVAQAADCSTATFVTAFSAISPYSDDVAFILTGADGAKTVCVQYKDAAGNITSNATDSIILDTIAPDVTVSHTANGDQRLEHLRTGFGDRSPSVTVAAAWPAPRPAPSTVCRAHGDRLHRARTPCRSRVRASIRSAARSTTTPATPSPAPTASRSTRSRTGRHRAATRPTAITGWNTSAPVSVRRSHVSDGGSGLAGAPTCTVDEVCRPR